MKILDALGYGGIVAVIGMLIVFVGLTILILCISAMGAIFKRRDQKKKSEPKAVTEAAPAPAAVPVVESVQEITDPQLIAVISAALAAFDQSGKRLVVRKVRRVPAWNSAPSRCTASEAANEHY